MSHVQGRAYAVSVSLITIKVKSSRDVSFLRLLKRLTTDLSNSSSKVVAGSPTEDNSENGELIWR